MVGVEGRSQKTRKVRWIKHCPHKTKKRKNNYIKSFEVRYGINFNVKRNEKEKFQIIFKNI